MAGPSESDHRSSLNTSEGFLSLQDVVRRVLIRVFEAARNQLAIEILNDVLKHIKIL